MSWMLITGHPAMLAFATLLLCLAAQAAVALDAQSINEAQWSRQADSKGGLSPVVAKAQILLDRAHFSPGEIDGKLGENFKKALTAFGAEQAVEARGQFSEEVEKADFFVRGTGPDRNTLYLRTTFVDRSWKRRQRKWRI